LVEYGRDRPRVAATVQHSNYNKGLFVRRIGDQVVSHRSKAQRSCGEIGPTVSLIWKRRELGNGFEYLLAQASRSERTIVSDEFPYFGNVLGRARMEIETRR
jgi:hypothetical protein